jgi:hypothetical protein
MMNKESEMVEKRNVPVDTLGGTVVYVRASEAAHFVRKFKLVAKASTLVDKLTELNPMRAETEPVKAELDAVMVKIRSLNAKFRRNGMFSSVTPEV